MRINIKFIYLLIGIGFTYFTDKMFLEVIMGKGSPFQLPYTRIVWMGVFIGSFLLVNYMSNFMRGWFIVISLGFFYLVLESLWLYGSPFQYPRVFAKILELFSIFYIYALYKKFAEKISLQAIINFITIFFIINAILINRDAFSLSSFESHNRGLSAESVFFLVIPFLFYFNKYFYEKKTFNLLISIFFLLCIIFLQHRTVWITSFIALCINFLLLKKASIKLEFNAFIPILSLGVIGAFFIGAYVLTNEAIVAKLAKNIDDIMNPTSQGTGNWRWVQFTSYWPFIVDNFMFGMRLEGFELPVQFFDRDTLAFEDGTGHHFHSFYVDRLFYFGFAGLVALMAPAIFYITFLVKNTKKLSYSHIAFLAYICSAIFYGISYKLQLNVYASIGFLIFYLEQEYLRNIEFKQLEEKQDIEVRERLLERLV